MVCEESKFNITCFTIVSTLSVSSCRLMESNDEVSRRLQLKHVRLYLSTIYFILLKVSQKGNAITQLLNAS